MGVAIVIFDGFYLEDLMKFYKKILEISDENIKICAFKSEVKSSFGVKVVADCVCESLDGYNKIFIVGGDLKTILYDEIFLSWLRSGMNCEKIFATNNSDEILKTAKIEKFLKI